MKANKNNTVVSTVENRVEKTALEIMIEKRAQLEQLQKELGTMRDAEKENLEKEKAKLLSRVAEIEQALSAIGVSRRGRPVGSKNTPKAEKTAEKTAEASAVLNVLTGGADVQTTAPAPVAVAA